MALGPFPDDFLWGAATAGHQVEGFNSTSDTWFLENVSPTIFQEPSGPACNSYALWETDLDMVAELGLTAYRFSVEWARIEPVEGQFDDEDILIACDRCGLRCRYSRRGRDPSVQRA